MPHGILKSIENGLISTMRPFGFQNLYRASHLHAEG